MANIYTDAIQCFILPKSQTELRSFVGICSLYRRFVPNFARVAAPLIELLTEGYGPKLPHFDERKMEAFNLLKKPWWPRRFFAYRGMASGALSTPTRASISWDASYIRRLKMGRDTP